VLQPVVTAGASARPFITLQALERLYLRIADELYLKRCIVGGSEGVQIGQDFRK